MKYVSEKDVLEAARFSGLPGEQLWQLLNDLGIGTRELPASKVREVVRKHAQTNGWPSAIVEDTLAELGALEDTEKLNPEVSE